MKSLVVFLIVVALMVSGCAQQGASGGSTPPQAQNTTVAPPSANPGAGSLQTQTQSYWGSMTPFAIKSVRASGTALSLELMNNGERQETLTDIQINGASVSPAGVPLTFNSGQDQVVTATLVSPCGASGASFTFNKVAIVYSQGPIGGLKESGTEPLVGQCS